MNQMNIALVENVNVLETCMEAVTSEFIFKIISVRKQPSDAVSSIYKYIKNIIYLSDDQTGLSMFESDIRTGICNEILSQFVPRFEFATHQRPAKLTEKP